MARIRDILLSKSLTAIEVILIGVLLVFGFTKDIASVEFHPDESFWIVSSVRLDKLLAGDFNSAVWTEDPIIIFEVRPLPSYFTAIGQRLGGISANELPAYWDWGLSDEENIASGAMPDAETIWWSRLPMAVIGAVSLLFISVLLGNSHSRLAAYVFTLVSFNEYFLLQLRRAMSEASVLFFTVLAMLASIKLMTAVRNDDTRKSVQWALIAGLFSGLAGQSKLTGLACAGIAILGVLLVFNSNPFRWFAILQQRKILIVILVVTVATISTFIASYPSFYEDMLDKISETLYARDQTLAFQVATYTWMVIPPDQRGGLLFSRVFEYPINLHANQWIMTMSLLANFLLAIVGLVYTVGQAFSGILHREIYLVLLLGALFFAAPMLFIPLDWDRYYLFPIFFTCIFFAIGISEMTIKLSRRHLHE